MDAQPPSTPVRKSTAPASSGVMSAISLPVTGLNPLTGDLRVIATELLTREEGALRRVIQRYVKDGATVDDLYQEVSMKVLRRIDSVRDAAAVRGWLFQLARNACLDWLRREDRRHQQAQADFGDHTANGEMGRSPGERFLSTERVDAVQRALGELPASQREVIRLRIEEDLDHAAIATRLGISRQAVEVRLCRGRATLKSRLDDILGGGL